MDFGERQVFEAADAQASEPFDAPVHSALPDIPAVLPPPGSLPPAPVAASLNLRTAVAVAFSGAVHAGALGLFIFLAPPVNEQAEVLEIPIEVVAGVPDPLAENVVQAEPPQPEPETPAPALAETPPPEAEMAVEPAPVVAEALPEPPVAEPKREPESVVTETAPQPVTAEAAPVAVAVAAPEPVAPKEPETQIATLAAPPVELPPVAPAPAIVPPPPLVVPRVPPPPKAEAPKREEPRKPPARREVEERKPAPRPVAARPAPERPVERLRTAALPPPQSSPPKPAAPAPSAASIGAWRSGIAARIAGNRSYPDGARARGAAGTTVVSLAIGPGGQLAGASVSSSSGHSDLDAASLSSVRRAAPFPPPPPGAPRSLAVPFRYGLR